MLFRSRTRITGSFMLDKKCDAKLARFGAVMQLEPYVCRLSLTSCSVSPVCFFVPKSVLFMFFPFRFVFASILCARNGKNE